MFRKLLITVLFCSFSPTLEQEINQPVAPWPNKVAQAGSIETSLDLLRARRNAPEGNKTSNTPTTFDSGREGTSGDKSRHNCPLVELNSVGLESQTNSTRAESSSGDTFFEIGNIAEKTKVKITYLTSKPRGRRRNIQAETLPDIINSINDIGTEKCKLVLTKISHKHNSRLQFDCPEMTLYFSEHLAAILGYHHTLFDSSSAIFESPFTGENVLESLPEEITLKVHILEWTREEKLISLNHRFTLAELAEEIQNSPVMESITFTRLTGDSYHVRVKGKYAFTQIMFPIHLTASLGLTDHFKLRDTVQEVRIPGSQSTVSQHEESESEISEIFSFFNFLSNLIQFN